MGARLALAACAVLLLAAPSAGAHAPAAGPADRTSASGPAVRQADVASTPCPGPAIAPDRVLTGQFEAAQQGSYVLLPVDVPAGQTALRVKYCYDQAEAPSALASHTLDLGLYEPRRGGAGVWGVEEFRGWGGSSHPDVTLSREGYSSEERYKEDPRAHVPGKTTRAFRPGPIGAGRWAVELGVASVVPRSQGDVDGRVAWRVEVDWNDDPSFADEPYRPARYDASPAREQAGWYAGDLHVHAEHSALGDAPMSEVFEFAFAPLDQGGAGLDFVTLSDYVSGSSWTEIGRFQERHPGRLLARSAEVITYRGHANSHANTAVVDYRTGPLLVRRDDGRLEQVRGPRPARDLFEAIRAAEGFTQINHPTIFPSAVPLFAGLCRGCPWDYSAAQTDYSRVDAIEVATGSAGLDAPTQPGPNPFTVTAIAFWEEALAAGHRIAAVGSSDSHHAGRTPNPVTQAPIGTATTVVHAPELSEQGITEGVRAGHTYVKVTGNAAPDLRLEARADGAPGPPAIMGDTVRGRRVTMVARVLGGAADGDAGPRQLLVVKDGTPVQAATVSGDDFTHRFEASGPGRYRLQLQRGTTIEALTSPIYVEAPGQGAQAAAPGDRPARDGGGGGREPAPAAGGPNGAPAPDAAVGGASTAGGGAAEPDGPGQLPFTGAFVAVVALAGGGCLGAGAALRRRRRG